MAQKSDDDDGSEGNEDRDARSNRMVIIGAPHSAVRRFHRPSEGECERFFPGRLK
jgi:hypothetical protein